MGAAAIDIDAFVADVRDAFDRAAARDGHRWTLRLAGRRVDLRIAGPPLVDLYVPALAGLVGDDAEPGIPADLRIGCWERRATGVAPPPPRWPLDDFLPRGRIRGVPQDRVRVGYDEWTRTLTVYDRATREAFVHVADARLVPAWVGRAPLRNVLTWWAGDHSLAFLHASAVADPDGAVAIAGASGSGKSTTALTCAADGLTLLGDDACVAAFDDDVTLHPVYAFAKVERDALRRLPELRSAVLDEGAEQLVVALPRLHRDGVPLRGVLLPRVAHAPDTWLEPVAPREALHTLVPGSLLEGDGAGGTALRTLTQLVQRVPCARLHLGTDRAGVVRAVRDALASEGAPLR